MAESIIPESAMLSLPILALRNSVLFPAAVVPVSVMDASPDHNRFAGVAAAEDCP